MGPADCVTTCRTLGETHPGQHRVGATAVQPRVFAARPHTGLELSDFQPVTIDQVRNLLASIPRKTSPLDVLHVSVLKDCAEVFAPAITTLANLSLHTGKFQARFESAQVLPLLKKRGSTGRCQSTTGRYLTNRQSPRCSRDLCWYVYVPISPTPRTSASGSRPTGKDIRPSRRCSMPLTASTLRLTARKSHCSLASISLQPSTRSVTRH